MINEIQCGIVKKMVDFDLCSNGHSIVVLQDDLNQICITTNYVKYELPTLLREWARFGAQSWCSCAEKEHGRL